MGSNARADWQPARVVNLAAWKEARKKESRKHGITPEMLEHEFGLVNGEICTAIYVNYSTRALGTRRGDWLIGVSVDRFEPPVDEFCAVVLKDENFARYGLVRCESFTRWLLEHDTDPAEHFHPDRIDNLWRIAGAFRNGHRAPLNVKIRDANPTARIIHFRKRG